MGNCEMYQRARTSIHGYVSAAFRQVRKQATSIVRLRRDRSWLPKAAIRRLAGPGGTSALAHLFPARCSDAEPLFAIGEPQRQICSSLQWGITERCPVVRPSCPCGCRLVVLALAPGRCPPRPFSDATLTLSPQPTTGGMQCVAELPVAFWTSSLISSPETETWGSISADLSHRCFVE